MNGGSGSRLRSLRWWWVWRAVEVVAGLGFLVALLGLVAAASGNPIFRGVPAAFELVSIAGGGEAAAGSIRSMRGIGFAEVSGNLPGRVGVLVAAAYFLLASGGIAFVYQVRSILEEVLAGGDAGGVIGSRLQKMGATIVVVAIALYLARWIGSAWIQANVRLLDVSIVVPPPVHAQELLLLAVAAGLFVLGALVVAAGERAS